MLLLCTLRSLHFTLEWVRVEFELQVQVVGATFVYLQVAKHFVISTRSPSLTKFDVCRLRGNIIISVSFAKGTVNKNSSYSPVGP